ncbi:MAG: hypothetical protein QOF61_1235 [Acidobacteriota bacterium]|jgi:hypothetical protein|nr:hypothetical protein [Acidobacteriota bacterium]
MPTKYPVDTVLTNSERIARVWAENPTFTLGEVTLKSLQDRIAAVREKRERLEGLKMQVTALSNELGEDVTVLAGICTRGLSGLRAVYGPNSTQYEQGGGTRTDERRRAARKKNGDPK